MSWTTYMHQLELAEDQRAAFNAEVANEPLKREFNSLAREANALHREEAAAKQALAAALEDNQAARRRLASRHCYVLAVDAATRDGFDQIVNAPADVLALSGDQRRLLVGTMALMGERVRAGLVRSYQDAGRTLDESVLHPLPAFAQYGERPGPEQLDQ